MMAAPWSLDRCAVGGQGSLEGAGAVVPGVLFNAQLTPPQVRLAIQPARQNALFIHLVLS